MACFQSRNLTCVSPRGTTVSSGSWYTAHTAVRCLLTCVNIQHVFSLGYSKLFQINRQITIVETKNLHHNIINWIPERNDITAASSHADHQLLPCLLPHSHTVHSHTVPSEWWESVRGVSHGGSGGQQCRWPSNCRKLRTHNGFTWDFLIPSPVVLQFHLGLWADFTSCR